MSELLLFRLFGPFASWGEVAVGEVRPSALRPTRSALLGLLGAALGLERQDDAPHLALSRSVRFAVRIDSPGVPAVDYHTVNHRKADRKELILTRADEVRVRRDALSTVQSWRHYRCDSLLTVAVEAVAPTAGASPSFPLSKLAEALERPVFPLSLGRKSCVLALPIGPVLYEAETLLDAFARFDRERAADLPPWYPEKLRLLHHIETLELALDAAFALPVGTSQPGQLVARRDEILSRRRWRFEARQERVLSLPRHQAQEEAGDDSQPSLAS